MAWTKKHAHLAPRLAMETGGDSASGLPAHAWEAMREMLHPRPPAPNTVLAG